MSYTDVTQQLRSVDLDCRDPRLNTLLEQVSQMEDKIGRGMLSALVVHKSGDKLPGQGFFDLAKRLGRDVKDQAVCWAIEVEKVYKYWQNQNNGWNCGECGGWTKP